MTQSGQRDPTEWIVAMCRYHLLLLLLRLFLDQQRQAAGQDATSCWSLVDGARCHVVVADAKRATKRRIELFLLALRRPEERQTKDTISLYQTVSVSPMATGGKTNQRHNFLLYHSPRACIDEGNQNLSSTQGVTPSSIQFPFNEVIDD